MFFLVHAYDLITIHIRQGAADESAPRCFAELMLSLS